MKSHKIEHNHEKKRRKFDEVFAVLIVALLIIAISIYTRAPSSDDAHKITELIVDHHELSFASNGVIDNQKLDNVKSMDYEQLRDELEVSGEFCVYIEDENGNLLLAKSFEKLGQDDIRCKE